MLPAPAKGKPTALRALPEGATARLSMLPSAGKRLADHPFGDAFRFASCLA